MKIQKRRRSLDKKDAEVLGNTIPARTASFRARSFQITLNEIKYYQKIENYFLGLKNISYYISCKEEAPTTGHEHIHIYAHFSRSFELRASKVYGAHIEIAKGSPQENIDYIEKKNDPEKRGEILREWGDRPKQGGKTIKAIKAMTPEEREELPLVYYNIISKIQEKESNELTLDDFGKDIKCWWIYGESGIGKTELAKKIISYIFHNSPKPIPHTFNLVKYEGTFWHGVGEQSKIALYDDFRDSHMKPSELINFIDYNIHPMNIKGGSIKNHYNYIIITSIQNPDEIYKNVGDEPRKQWIRRMQILYLDTIERAKEYLDSIDISFPKVLE